MICACGKETMSFVDVISTKGMVASRPTCPACQRKIRARNTSMSNGDVYDEKEGMIYRLFLREYKPSGTLEFLFKVADLSRKKK